MKHKIIIILSAIFQAIDTLLCKSHIKRPIVVVFMDGGICSQMLMYMQGTYYAEQGLDVRYDTRWFDICGKDQFGNHSRIFEFTEMWPTLPFKKISGLRLWIYRHLFKVGQLMNEELSNPATITHSMYLYGYWDLPMGESARLFSKCFDLNIAATPTISQGFVFDKTIGVHVRRGDLAKGDNPIYGGVTDGYFLRAIEFCKEKFHPSKYLFFSDEPDWVEQNICNHITQPYEIMRGNKAWEDLWLLAHCPVIVASQGSFGKVAAQLNPKATLIRCDNQFANRDREKTYYIK